MTRHSRNWTSLALDKIVIRLHAAEGILARHAYVVHIEAVAPVEVFLVCTLHARFGDHRLLSFLLSVSPIATFFLALCLLFLQLRQPCLFLALPLIDEKLWV